MLYVYIGLLEVWNIFWFYFLENHIATICWKHIKQWSLQPSEPSLTYIITCFTDSMNNTTCDERILCLESEQLEYLLAATHEFIKNLQVSTGLPLQFPCSCIVCKGGYLFIYPCIKLIRFFHNMSKLAHLKCLSTNSRGGDQDYFKFN